MEIMKKDSIKVFITGNTEPCNMDQEKIRKAVENSFKTEEPLSQQLQSMTNWELFNDYFKKLDHFTVEEINDLANEVLKRWSWYMQQGKLPDFDTAAETYKLRKRGFWDETEE